MAAYGVPDDPDGLLPWSWAEQRLLSARNFWLVTADGNGRPHSMPVWGVWMPDRDRWGVGCAPTARKARNMEANDQVVVTTEDTVEFVSIEGRAVRVEGDEALPMAQAWADKYHDDTQPSKEEMVEFMLQGATFEVIPERAFGMIETPGGLLSGRHPLGVGLTPAAFRWFRARAAR